MNYPISGHDPLRYAESRGIAIHPFETDITSLLSPIAELCQPAGHFDEIKKRYEGQYSVSMDKLESLKLRLSHESARLLCAVQNAVKAEIPVNWDAILPPVHRFSVINSELPLLTEQEERELQPSSPQKGTGLDLLQFIKIHRSLPPSIDIDPPASIMKVSQQCKNDLGTDKLKLNIRNESLVLMSRAHRLGASPGRIVGSLFDELFQVFKVSCSFENWDWEI